MTGREPFANRPTACKRSTQTKERKKELRAQSSPLLDQGAGSNEGFGSHDQNKSAYHLLIIVWRKIETFSVNEKGLEEGRSLGS